MDHTHVNLNGKWWTHVKKNLYIFKYIFIMIMDNFICSQWRNAMKSWEKFLLLVNVIPAISLTEKCVTSSNRERDVDRYRLRESTTFYWCIQDVTLRLEFVIIDYSVRPHNVRKWILIISAALLMNRNPTLILQLIKLKFYVFLH